MNWSNLTSIDQLEQLADNDFVVFKHSTRCGVSSMALKQFKSEMPENGIHCYLLDLLQHRDVSEYISNKWGVVHESPQVLLIQGGRCTYTASHQNINAGAVSELLTHSA